MTVPTVTFDKISTIVTPIISWHVTILPGSVSQLVTIPDCLSHYSLFTVPPIAKAGNSLNTLSLFCQLSVVLTHDTITTFAWLRTKMDKRRRCWDILSRDLKEKLLQIHQFIYWTHLYFLLLKLASILVSLCS